MFRKPDGVGKGDEPRRMSISKKEYDKRWEKIFGKKTNKTKVTGMGGPQMKDSDRFN
jgi:hypothetical protein